MWLPLKIISTRAQNKIILAYLLITSSSYYERNKKKQVMIYIHPGLYELPNASHKEVISLLPLCFHCSFVKILLLFFHWFLFSHWFMYLSIMNFEFLDVKDPYWKQNTKEKPWSFIFALRHINIILTLIP